MPQILGLGTISLDPVKMGVIILTSKAGIIHKTSMRIAGLAVCAVLSLAPTTRADSIGEVLYPIKTPAGFSTLDIGEQFVGPSQAASGEFVTTGNTATVSDAILWNPDGSSVNLNPLGYAGSSVNATNGSQQVGTVSPTISANSAQAYLWNGTADGGVNLSPSWVGESFANGTDGTNQVGDGSEGTLGNDSHALLWSGTADSAIDLNPTGFANSFALGVSGNQQVGWGYGTATKQNYHALLWSGTAASAVDLNPKGANISEALGVGGNQEVGFVAGNAMLWTGSAASAVDLGTNFGYGSIASDTNGSQQVGEEWDGDHWHAVLWSGTAASAVNLESLLPATGAWTDSYATSIDPAGNVFGYADGTYNGNGGTFAVEWTAVPEPTSLTVLMAFSGLILRRQREKLC
jgi:hypothetical protein